MTDPQRYSPQGATSSDAEKSRPLWHYYVGIAALLLVMVVTLTGGIIWYNSKKTNQLAFAAAERMMLEAGEDVSNRIKLLYDPMYAIVGIASLVPELTSPAIKENPHALSLMLHVLRIYPQILSLYVGFDNGEFFMVTHITGENSAALRDALHAPPDAAFANEIVSADAAGARSTRWVFLADDGSVVGRSDGAAFDPRESALVRCRKAQRCRRAERSLHFRQQRRAGLHIEPQLHRGARRSNGRRPCCQRPCSLSP